MTRIFTNKTFGLNLQRIRNQCGLTQDETTAQLQVLGSPLTRSGYAMIELGKANIFVTDLAALQTIFQVDYAEFFKDIPVSRTNKNSEKL